MGLFNLANENVMLKSENRKLKKLCAEKDSYFSELMSDALRHGSKLAAKHMAEKKSYLKGR